MLRKLPSRFTLKGICMSSYLTGSALADALFPTLTVGPDYGKSWHQLSNKQRREHVAFAVQNCQFVNGVFGLQELILLSKAKQVDSATEADFSVGSGKERTHWKMEYNSRNRNISPSTIETYEGQIQVGEWRADGQPIAFYVDPLNGWGVATGQHRLAAAIRACIADASLRIPLSIVFGVPYSFSDGYDLSRRFSGVDLVSKHFEDICPPLAVMEKTPEGVVQQMQDSNGPVFCLSVDLGGNAQPTWVKELEKNYTTVMHSLRQRRTGKQGIRASGASDKDNLIQGKEGPLVAKTCQWVQRMCYGLNGTDRLKDILPHTQVALAMLLVANREQPKDVEPSELLDPQNSTECEAILVELLKDGMGDFDQALNPLRKPKGQPAMGNDMKFNHFVEACLAFLNGEVPQKITPAQAAKKWSKQLLDYSSGVAVRSDNPSFKGYPSFGGIDVGYVAPKRGRSKEGETEE